MECKKIRLSAPLTIDSIVDGAGLRCVIWTQGCFHNCKGCHNPQTHDISKGTLYDIEDIIKEILQTQLQNGITLSGGEPFLQCNALVKILDGIKEKEFNVWAYTGFLYEELIKDQEKKNLLEKIDVLVDGKFIEEEKDIYLRFKGSRNQRIIDVQKSLHENRICLSTYDN